MRATKKRSQRGFSLLAVIIILAVLVGGLLAILHDAGMGMRQQGAARSRELMNGAMDYGLNEAMKALARVDPDVLVASLSGATPNGKYDIFADWGNDTFTCNDGNAVCASPTGVIPYPTTGPNTGELNIRIGLRLGQKTKPPSGEDATKAYGFIVEVLIAVERNAANPDAAERAVYAVRLPQTFSHAN